MTIFLPRQTWALASTGMALVFLLTHQVPNIWHRMALLNLCLIPLALFTVELDWADLLKPRPKALAQGIGAAVALYFLAWAGFSMMEWAVPSLRTHVEVIYAWKDLLPRTQALALLALLIVPGEEIFWRAALALPLARRYGIWTSCLLAGALFSLAHITMGAPLLLVAALALGAVWSWLLLRTGSLIPPILCHLLWDATVLFWLPY